MDSDEIKKDKLRAEIVRVKKAIEKKKEKMRGNTLRLKMVNDTIEPEIARLKRRVVKLDFVKMKDDDFMDECEELKALLEMYEDEMSKGVNNG